MPIERKSTIPPLSFAVESAGLFAVVSPAAIPNTRKFLSLPAKSRCMDAAT